MGKRQRQEFSRCRGGKRQKEINHCEKWRKKPVAVFPQSPQCASSLCLRLHRALVREASERFTRSARAREERETRGSKPIWGNKRGSRALNWKLRSPATWLMIKKLAAAAAASLSRAREGKCFAIHVLSCLCIICLLARAELRYTMRISDRLWVARTVAINKILCWA